MKGVKFVLKSITQEYDSISFPSTFLPYIDKLLSQSRKTKDRVIELNEVLKLIGKNSPSPDFNEQNKQNNFKIGISQVKLEEELNIDRHILKEILGILSGAMLIQYDDQFRIGKYWTCTPRAWQYMLYKKKIKEDKK